MRNFAFAFLVTLVTGAVVNNMEREDPLTTPWEMENEAQIEFADPLAPPPPTEDDEPLSEAADPGRVSWAGVYEGDMILTDEQARDLYDNSTERQAKRDKKFLWPNAVIPYEHRAKDGHITDEDWKTIKKNFAEIAEKTCLRFVKRTNQRNFISIKRYQTYPGFAGRSPVGRQLRQHRQFLELWIVSKFVIFHEVMHLVGFHHEHSRYDRDNYVKIHWENTDPAMKYNLKKNTKEKTTNLGEPYDYDSIMHYGKNFVAKKKGLVTIERLDGKKEPLGSLTFSQGDIRKLNKLYSCSTRGCKDKSPKCPSWADDNNYCTTGKNITFMAENCKQSCNLCPCKDENVIWCPVWARNGDCVRARKWMHKRCPLSCGLCPI